MGPSWCLDPTVLSERTLPEALTSLPRAPAGSKPTGRRRLQCGTTTTSRRVNTLTMAATVHSTGTSRCAAARPPRRPRPSAG